MSAITTTPSSPSRLRLSVALANRKSQMPYENYSSSNILDVSTSPRARAHNWMGPRGYGARHSLDDAPFSLWDTTDTGHFRHPTKAEWEWLASRYSPQPTGIEIEWPVIVFEIESPPSLLPLTIACVSVRFVPPPPPDFPTARFLRKVRKLGDQIPSQSTDYSGPRGPPGPLNFQFRKWVRLSDEQLEALVDKLFDFSNPKKIYIICPWIFVKLNLDDGRTYGPRSLPAKIGGYCVQYHHGKEPLFKGLVTKGMERLVVPTTTVEDNSNYLSAFNELCPGVRVESSKATDIGEYAEILTRTTAGVLVRDNYGKD